ncbi:MAG: hypothetical protein ACLSHC_03330 [Bilophila wadsworthia]
MRQPITDETLNPSGGVFRMTATAASPDWWRNPPQWRWSWRPPADDPGKWLGAVERATDDYVAKGVTTAHDGGVTTAMWKTT